MPFGSKGSFIRATKFVILVGAALVVFRAASATTLLSLSLLAFWFAVLPGSLIIALVFAKSLKKFETWVIGTAVGINLLPVLDKVGAVFTSDAGLLWNVITIVLSILNLLLLARVRKGREPGSSKFSTPVFPIIAFTLLFFGTVLTSFFRRDLTNGVYTFQIFYGGDMGWLGSNVECLETHTSLSEWHFGGMPLYYHDFTFRMLAGLHRLTGGSIYDALWYFQTTFDLLLLYLLLWIVLKKLTGSGVAAWVAIGFSLLAGYYNIVLFFVSASMQLCFVEALAVVYFIVEIAHASTTNHARRAGVLYAILVACSPGWKLTLVMVMIPALLVVSFVLGIRQKRWGFFLLTLGGSTIAFAFFLFVYAHAGNFAGPPIMGRPLLLFARILNKAFSWNLNPVTPLHSPLVPSVLALMLLLPVFALKTLLSSGRYMSAVFVFPKRMYHQSLPPYSTLFFVCVMVIGECVGIVVSPQYYHYADFYQPMMARLILVIPFSIVIGYLWSQRRSLEFRKTGKLAIALMVLAVMLELGRGARGYVDAASSGRESIPIALIEDLEHAAPALPGDALIATRRYNLSARSAAWRLSMPRSDWNFEFYSASLRHPVIVEGPSDGFYGGSSSVDVDSALMMIPNPILGEYLWRSSRLLDSVYDSQSTEVASRALDSLHATHLLIDHTINQRLASTLAESLDTVYSGKQIALLRVRRSISTPN